MKKASVVILNWNGEKLLSQFIPSVLKYTNELDVEVVVADNASTDDSVNFIRNRYPQVRLVLLQENLGYAGGYNEALKNVDAEYLILLNSDVEVTESWLTPVLNYMDEHENIAAVQPKILSFRNKDCFEYAGAAGGFIDKYGYPFCRGRIFDKVEKDENQYNDISDVFWASGACLIVRSCDFFSAGGFDASFFAHMEEIDLCWRFNARGKRVVCYPHSTVYHVGAATLAVENPRKTFLNFRNNLLMLYKNLPDADLNKTLAIRKCLDYVAALQMLLTGKAHNAKAVLKAHAEVRKIRKNYTVKRSVNIEQTVTPSIKTVYPKSILWAFHAKHKQLFKDLKFLK